MGWTSVAVTASGQLNPHIGRVQVVAAGAFSFSPPPPQGMDRARGYHVSPPPSMESVAAALVAHWLRPRQHLPRSYLQTPSSCAVSGGYSLQFFSSQFFSYWLHVVHMIIYLYIYICL